jgi:ABC-type oligopeptide transport system substrate-binding subunit
MQFNVVPFQQYDALIRSGNFDAVLIDMIGGPTLGRAHIFWRSAKQFHGLNVFGYESPEAERLFDVLRASGSNELATRSATRALQRVFLDDPPAVFLSWNERSRAIRRSFQVVEEQGRDPILTLWRWVPNADSSIKAVASR